MEYNIFQEMQMMALVDDSGVAETRKKLNEIVKFWRDQPWQEEQISYFARMRKLKVETLNKLDSFMVTDDFPYNSIPEEYRHDSYGFCDKDRIIFSGRYVIPVKDVKGNTMGFCGYDKFEQPKYLDSKNHGYKAKDTTFLGMERLSNYYDTGYIIIVEGPMCMAWLVENDFNAVASLGSYLNEYLTIIAKRFGRNAIFIPDGDEAGSKYERQIRANLPNARILRPCLAKDVDDSRQLDEEAVRAELRNIISCPFGRRKYFLGS